jgi:hypothetical protein
MIIPFPTTALVTEEKQLAPYLAQLEQADQSF